MDLEAIKQYKKNNVKTKEITTPGGLTLEIRKPVVFDYAVMNRIPLIYRIDDSDPENERVSKAFDRMSEDELEETARCMKVIVCNCVVGKVRIVDKSESECGDFELSYKDTLSEVDAYYIYCEIDSSGKGGGSDELERFSEEQNLSKDNNDNIREIQGSTA